MGSPRQGIKDMPSICARLGMKHVIIAPGSRNAPLIISFTHNKEIIPLSIVDERSAGYFAIGIAQSCLRPVGIVCTSGTAALNFMPAVAEAFYQNLPLIVFTADRPPEWIDQADGQTIRQKDVFRNHVKQSFELPVETALDIDLWYNNRIVSQAIDLAMQPPRGPVHINVPLREPLYESLPPGNSNLQIIQTTSLIDGIAENALQKFRDKWKASPKKMIIAGFRHDSDALNEILAKLIVQQDVVILAENLSNLNNPDFIYAPERLFAALNEDEKEAFRPDLLITIGNSIVSKRIKQYLRKYRPAEHWHVDKGNAYIDTFQSLKANIKSDPEDFFSLLLSEKKSSAKNSGYKDLFMKKEEKIQKKHDQFLEHVPFSDLKAFEAILNKVPEESNLHLSNSTAVRYAQFFRSRSGIKYFGNRGTSGIDGCISTAAGMSFAKDKSTTIITGDIAFIYDSGALWNNYLNKYFRIIVMNNGGGNIFRLIETGTEMEKAGVFFETRRGPRPGCRSLTAGSRPRSNHGRAQRCMVIIHQFH